MRKHPTKLSDLKLTPDSPLSNLIDHSPFKGKKGAKKEFTLNARCDEFIVSWLQRIGEKSTQYDTRTDILIDAIYRGLIMIDFQVFGNEGSGYQAVAAYQAAKSREDDLERDRLMDRDFPLTIGRLMAQGDVDYARKLVKQFIDGVNDPERLKRIVQDPSIREALGVETETSNNGTGEMDDIGADAGMKSIENLKKLYQ